MTESNTLSAIEVAYAYDKSDPVLEDISASVVPGSFLAILGVNGCGKSTLLSCLDDILHPQSGKVMLAGTDMSQISREERARSIALVAQHSHAHGVTVYDALLLGRKPYMKAAPGEDDLEAVDRVIDELDLGDLALRYLDELSGGEYQKVVIGRALVQETGILLLDEPTNNLDMSNQEEVMGLICRAAHERNLACAVVMHDINLALRYCDRFIMLKDGKVRASGGHEVITQDSIKEVYGVDVDIIMHDDAPIVVPAKERQHHARAMLSTEAAVT